MTYEVIAEIGSENNPDRKYKISKDEHGKLSCNCPSWRFMNAKVNNGEHIRYCKHLKEYWQRILK